MLIYFGPAPHTLGHSLANESCQIGLDTAAGEQGGGGGRPQDQKQHVFSSAPVVTW